MKEDRRVTGYLPPLYAKLTRNYSEQTGQSVSTIIVAAVRDKFDRMPVSEKEKILKTKK